MARILTKTYKVQSSVAEARQTDGATECVLSRVAVICEFEIAAAELETDAAGKRRLSTDAKARLLGAVKTLVHQRSSSCGSALRADSAIDVKMLRLGVYHGTSEQGVCRGYVRAQYKRNTWWALA